MALKVLMMRSKLDKAKKELEALRAKAQELDAREAELAADIEAAETDEERAAVEEAVAAFETERAENAEQTEELETTVRDIEAGIEELEASQEPAGAAPAEEPETAPAVRTERSTITMNTRNIFRSMPMQERDALFAREDVRTFLEQVRTAIGKKRAIEGGELLIPEIFLGLIRENIVNYSKLYKHVNVRSIGGKGRVLVMGTIPEGIWTDCCAILNEMSLTFNDAEVGCWKVGGYFDICNATLEDSMIDLASELMTTIGQAIGYALDKALLFGLGTRMPLGIFTRLAQTSEPADYPATARPWEDLHETNIITIEAQKKNADLVSAIVEASGAAKGKYARGEKVWVMNEKTYTSLAAATVTTTATGSIVTGVFDRMPVVGGIIEVLDFLPDNVIIGGFFELYLLAERASITLAQSEHVRFIEDRTVFKGTARYDGLPVIAEGFVAIGLNGTTPDASEIEFAPDVANNPES